MKSKIVITQRMIQNYRIPFLLQLNKYFRSSNSELKVYYGFGSFTNKNPNKFLNKLFSFNLEITWSNMNAKVVLLPSLLLNLIRYKPDLIISEGSSFMPNILIIYLYSKLFSVPYIVWGLGAVPNWNPSKYYFIIQPFLEIYEKNATAFLCYSTYAKDYYFNKYEKPCYCAFNSTEQSHSEMEYKIIKSDINKKYKNLKQLNIVFIGRLITQKKVNLLLEAISMIKDIPIHLYIIGDGDQKKELIKLTKVLKIDNKVSFLGKISEKDKKEEIFKKCHLGILPGLGGLAIQEMLWYGIPVITSSADGTELDLVKKGKSGIYLEKMSNKNLSYVIVDYYKIDKDKKIQMAHNGLKIINNKYNLDKMVNSFISAIKDNLY